MKTLFSNIAFFLIALNSCVKPLEKNESKANVEKEKKYLKVSCIIHEDTIKMRINNISDSALHYNILLHGSTDSTGHTILFDIRNVKSYKMGFKVPYDSIKIEKKETQLVAFPLNDLKEELGIDYLKRHDKFCLYYRILSKKFTKIYSQDIVYFRVIYGKKIKIELVKDYQIK